MKGRERFGFLSAGFDVFVKMKCLFFIVPEVSFGEVTGVFFINKYTPEATDVRTERWACVQYVLTCSAQRVLPRVEHRM